MSMSSLEEIAIFVTIGAALGGNIGLMSATEHPENAIFGSICGIALGAVFGLLVPKALTR